MRTQFKLTMALVCFAAVQGANAQTWQTVWNDEFSSGTQPNTSLWGYELGAGGWGNNELQNYTNRALNARIETTDGGRLKIEARRDFYQGVEYSSARLFSKGSWTYGKLEVRAKLPSGLGTWPAIWMLPTGQWYGNNYWPDNGEIDVMEHVGYDPNRIHGSVHTQGYNWMNGNQPTNNVVLADVFNTYHAYTLEWRPHALKVSVDGTSVLIWNRTGGASSRWPFNRPFSLRLNLAVGGNWGGAQGVNSAAFPTSMLVDYVRFSKATTAPFSGTAAALPGKVQAEDFDNGGADFAFYDADGANQGGLGYRSNSVDIENSGADDGTPTIGWIAKDEWWAYSVQLAKETTGDLEFRVSTPNAGRSFEVQVDDQPIGTVMVPKTNGWYNFQTATLKRVRLAAGAHKIRVISNSDEWNFNYFNFVQKAYRDDVEVQSGQTRG